MSKFEGMKACLAVILCLSCICDLCDTVDPCPPVPEFQFPCYVDVCTFPRQFCNSDRSERRCSPCTRRICADEKVPQACKYYCTRYEEPKTTPTTATPENVQGSHDKQSEDDGLRLLMGYSAIAITVLAILVIFFGCYFGFVRRHSATMTSLPRSYTSVRGHKLETSQLLRDTEQHLTDDLESGEVRLNIHVPRMVDSQISDPPTYTTEDPILGTNKASSNLAVSNNSASDQSGGSTPSSDQSAASSAVAASRQSATETHRMVSFPYRTNPTSDAMHEGRHEKPWRLDDDRHQQMTELNNISRRNGNGSIKINNNMTSNQQSQSIADASPAQNITTVGQLDNHRPRTVGMINNDLERSSNDAAVNTNMIDTGGTPDTRSEETAQRSYENSRTIPHTANERRRVTAMEAENSQTEDRRIPVGSEREAEYTDEVFSPDIVFDECVQRPGTRAGMNRQQRADSGLRSGNDTDETSVKGI